jgi:hypothetical protein
MFDFENTSSSFLLLGHSMLHQDYDDHHSNHEMVKNTRCNTVEVVVVTIVRTLFLQEVYFRGELTTLSSL